MKVVRSYIGVSELRFLIRRGQNITKWPNQILIRVKLINFQAEIYIY